MPKEIKNVLLIGGAGYIGSVLCQELLSKNYRVRCFDRLYFGLDTVKHCLKHKNFELMKGDIRTIKKNVFEDMEAVINLAGISNDPASELNPKVTEEVNYRAAVRSAKLARSAGVKRFLLSSTCSVYGTSPALQLREDSPKNPVSLYAKTKLLAENDIANLKTDKFCVTFLRKATVYGISYRMRFDLIVNIMTLHAHSNHKIFITGGGRQWRPLLHIKDACNAYLLVLGAEKERINGQAFNIGSNEQNYQPIQVANMIARIIPNTEIYLVPDDPDKRSYNVSFDKINKVLGFKVTKTVYDGIQEVKDGLNKRLVSGDDIKTHTLGYYKYLLELTPSKLFALTRLKKVF